MQLIDGANNVETLCYATKSSQSSAAQRDATTWSDQIAKAQRKPAALLLHAAIWFLLLKTISKSAAENSVLLLQKSAAAAGPAFLRFLRYLAVPASFYLYALGHIFKAM
jgi:hypothetical protein